MYEFSAIGAWSRGIEFLKARPRDHLVLLAVAGMAASRAGSPAFALFVLLFTALPIILLFATFSTLAAAMVGAGMALTLAVMMLVGGATGNVGLAATMFGGGSGFIVVLLLLLSILLLWLATRLSCVTAVMADRKSYNVIAAMRISWEVTAADQWGIIRYLALVGVILIVLLVAGVVAVGGGAAALQVNEKVAPQAAGLAVGLVFAGLFVFLAASVPAGIFLQMMGERAPVEVFA